MVEKYTIRTDLAMEQKERFESDHVEVSGVVLEEEYDEEREIKITTVRIETENGAKMMGKPVGTYLTLEVPDMASADDGYHREISETLAGFLEKYVENEETKNRNADNEKEHSKEKGCSILTVGLGNREVTPDALGPYVVDQAYGTGIWKIWRRRKKPDRKCNRSGSDGADRDGDGRDCAGSRKGDKAGYDPGDRCAGGKKQ